MHFNIIVTERSGMGIAWDEEQPPLYENVPASPPAYATGDAQVYNGEPIPDYEDLLPLEGIAAASAPSSRRGNGEGSSRRLSVSDLEQGAVLATRSTADSTEVEGSGDVEGTGVVEEAHGS